MRSFPKPATGKDMDEWIDVMPILACITPNKNIVNGQRWVRRTKWGHLFTDDKNHYTLLTSEIPWP
jgi:septin family protein